MAILKKSRALWMAATASAGPRAKRARSERDNGSNLRALDGRNAAGALDEWIELLARISHDLRTPLNAVIGFSDAMQNELFGPLGHRRYQEYARHIRDSGDRLLSATEETLAMTSLLATPQAVRIEDVWLADLVARAADDSSDGAGAASVELDIEIDPALRVRADAAALMRAVKHLLSAALPLCKAGGELRVTARVHLGRAELVLATDAAAERRDEPGSGDRNSAPIAPGERGLGRDELSLWLARVLLEMQDCTLTVGRAGAGMLISVGMEEAAQRDFFTFDPALTS